MRPRLLQPKTCPICKVEFRPKTARQQFCTAACSYLGRFNGAIVKCGWCLKELRRTKCRLTVETAYCSRECQHLGSRGKNRGEESLARMQQARHKLVEQQAERHQQRRRPKPTPEQRAALMREWILDMRAGARG